MTATVRVERVTPDNVLAACRLAVRPEQERYVAPVAVSLAEAYARPRTAWTRVLVDDGRVVAFVMAAFDPGNSADAFRCRLWRLAVGAADQGRGYGRAAVDAVLAEARRRGQPRVTVLWVPGEDGPEGFHLRLGFRPTGRTVGPRVVGSLDLDPVTSSLAARGRAAGMLRDAAERLDRAAGHCRMAAEHMDDDDVPRMGIHAWAARGDLLGATAHLDEAARQQAVRSMLPGDPTAP